jgi:hypothetical protein
MKIGAISMLWLAALVGFVHGAELRVDHVTVAGRDLNDLQKRFAAAGIRTEYGGKHTNGLTQMALASFADGSYLELIAAQDPKAGAPSHYWGKFIDGNAGPCAWAITSTDIDADAKLYGGQVTAGGRKRPDGTGLSWRSLSIGQGIQGTFFPFLIQDVTPRELRAYPSGKPTLPGERGVAAVYIAVRNLETAIALYRTMFHLPEPVRSEDSSLGAHLATFMGSPIVLAAPAGGWLEQRVRAFGEAPCAFVLKGDGQGRVQWLPIEGMKIGVLREHDAASRPLPASGQPDKR